MKLRHLDKSLNMMQTCNATSYATNYTSLNRIKLPTCPHKKFKLVSLLKYLQQKVLVILSQRLGQTLKQMRISTLFLTI